MQLSRGQLDAFQVYSDLLIAEGRRTNLTALREPGEISRRHFQESLALLEAIEAAGAFASPAIDAGTGAGFPGVPIKIARPEMELTLLEATGKKVAFLQRLVSRLGLSGVQVVYGRAEEVAHRPEQRESYALALARAVAPLPVLVELALPFLRTGGHLAAAKGSGAQREAREAEAALAACGGEVVSVGKLDVAGPGPAPSLVLIRKTAPTSERYPRRAGMPAKRPIRG